MKELKFNKEMQRAIDEGRKTQTRRVVMLEGVTKGEFYSITSPKESLIELEENEIIEKGTIHYLSTGGLSGGYECPYGKIGDINNGVKITGIRVERLQDISSQEAVSEGITWNQGEVWTMRLKQGLTDAYRSKFFDLWQSLFKNNPKKDWNLNPWVWVITFESVK